MAPPTVTPSPHRFVVKKEAPVHKTPLAQSHTPRPTTKPQFNATPRFTFSSTPRPTAPQTLPEPTPSAKSTPRFLTPATKKPKDQDDIQVSSDVVPYDIHDSIEINEPEVGQEWRSREGEEDEYKLKEPTPKRQRVSSSPNLLDDYEEDHDDTPAQEHNDEELQENEISSSISTLSSPPAAKRPIASTAPRFLLSTPLPPSSPHPLSYTTQGTFLKPPRFRPPDPSKTQAQNDPLPEQFSPHRRGQKYVAGGLATEVRDWLVNIESAIPSNGAQRSKDDPWVVKILIGEVSGGSKFGMTLVRGRHVREVGDGIGEERGVVKVILAGEGMGEGLQKGAKVEVGKTVGIKGPVWEVVLEGEKWGVGVDWKVLS